MAFEISTGKKKNTQGRVALSLRFRMGKVDQQAKTNLWISPAMVKTEKYRHSCISPWQYNHVIQRS